MIENRVLKWGNTVLYKREVYEEWQKNISGLDIVSILMEFTRSIRGDIGHDFMLGYIFKVLGISSFVREFEAGRTYDAEKVPEYHGRKLFLDATSISNVTMFLETNAACIDFFHTANKKYMDTFIEKVLLRAVNGNVDIDVSLSLNDPVLMLYSGNISVALDKLSRKISWLLMFPIHRKKTITKQQLKPYRKWMNELFESNFLV